VSWFHDLTGLASDERATVQAQVVPDAGVLRCLASGRVLRPGPLHVPSLAE